MPQYRALVGIDYPPNKRAEADDIISDLPEKDATWLLASGFIEALDSKGKKTTPVVEVVEESPTITPPYNPDAIDGDNDGTVQDGTAWERPSGTQLTDEEIVEIVKDGK